MQDKLYWMEEQDLQKRRSRKERRPRRPNWENDFLEEDWFEEVEMSEDLLRRKKGKAKTRREKMLDW
ncbi:MAG: hypothetical protein NZ750_07195 [Anaerolineae bacterium]|nr:hypothetical protein [Anaerolineae bacterium]MDW8170897.1 hypothetical protein [Anaerolineae bacterium]